MVLTTNQEADDALLAARIVEGDTRALEALMHRHAPRLVAIALAVTRSRETAHEVVQDVFIHLWEQRAALDPNRGVGGFLWRATRNRALSALRRERLDARTAQALVYATQESPPVSHNAGAQALDAASVVQELEEALEVLPPRCREIFLLKFKYEMTPENIATALGISLATVRNQLSRAVRLLAERWGQR